MNHLVEENRDELARLCVRRCVRRLELFGSGAGEGFDESGHDSEYSPCPSVAVKKGGKCYIVNR